MTPYQRISQELLLATGASRVMIQTYSPGAGLQPVAESIRHEAEQIRHGDAREPVFELRALEEAGRQGELISQEKLVAVDSPVAMTLANRWGVRSQLLAPLFRDGQLEGVIALHHTQEPRPWDEAEIAAVRASQAEALQAIASGRGPLQVSLHSIRGAAIQAILDHVRAGLGVQRCTFRQDASPTYAFPVTHESRTPGTRSLLGDFSIVQRGQPVIESMLRDRAQVVQHDSRTASVEPHFQSMLVYYGDMRSQIVTPLFREDGLAAVLSIHSLGRQRAWSAEEIAAGKSAARMLGLLVGATLA